MYHLLASANSQCESPEQQTALVKEIWGAKNRVCDVEQTLQDKDSSSVRLCHNVTA